MQKKKGMIISDKVRKELWAKSGNRCAICKAELFQSVDDNSFNIGEECHIVSAQSKGPRHVDNYDDFDIFDNIILLCRNHHKEIDDAANLPRYTIEELSRIKKDHEDWVNQNLSVQHGEFYWIINSGNLLASIISNNSFGFCKRNDELINDEEADLVGGFWQELTDFADVSDELEPSATTKQELVFSDMIKQLDQNGFQLLFREIKGRMLKKFGDNTAYDTVEFYIRRKLPDVLASD